MLRLSLGKTQSTVHSACVRTVHVNAREGPVLPNSTGSMRRTGRKNLLARNSCTVFGQATSAVHS